MNKRLFTTILAGVVTLSGMSQVSKTLSPYSQYGMGVLADQSQGFNRGMGGLSMGLRGGTIVNMLNPASYSAVDSLSMIFDMGISGQMTNFKEGGKKINRKIANFDYSVAMFNVAQKMGVSIGLVPFSNVGYNFTTQDRIGNSTTTSNMSYYGEGGFSQAFIGIGAQVLKGFSIGGNFSYAWGRFEKTLTISSNDSYVNTITKSYSTNISSYKIDLGAQYEKALSKNDVLTLGAAIGIGHNLGADANMTIVNKDGQTSTLTTKDTTLVDAFSLPNTFRIGAAWVHNKSLTIGADYALEKWGSLEFPESNEYTDRFEMSKSALRDRHKVIVGVDWIPDPNPMARRSFFKRMHYKFGASYATPYYNIKGQDGPREYALTAGFSIPIINSWNNRSVLSISAQWVNTSAKNFITENSFRINIGLTFNERWFAKWKVD